jgi:two-component system alkaline phosphatase synthesis response regulator PhoP
VAAPRILLVDDEQDLLAAIGYALRREGFAVETAETGPAALAAARASRFDLVVLDVMLPGLDGLQVCRALRAESAVPILFLSAKGEEIDRVVGLEIGADDYLTKPFAVRELIARIRAMLRRARMTEFIAAPPGVGFAGTPIDHDRSAADDGIAIDPARRLVSIAGRPLSLKPKEFDLLHYFDRHSGIVLSREVLLRQVWGYDFPIDTRTVDVHVRWLREKIEDDPARPRRIETVRGVGYRYVSNQNDDPQA